MSFNNIKFYFFIIIIIKYKENVILHSHTNSHLVWTYLMEHLNSTTYQQVAHSYAKSGSWLDVDMSSPNYLTSLDLYKIL